MYIKKTFIITTYSGSTRMYMGEIKKLKLKHTVLFAYLVHDNYFK